MDSAGQKQLQHMIDIEKKAEEILVDRNDIVSLDMRRNWDRESINAVRKLKPNEKVWTLLGPFVKLSKDEANKILKDDMIEANIEINKKRSDLKLKVNDLRDLEYLDRYKGFDLKPLDKKQLDAIKKMIGDP